MKLRSKILLGYGMVLLLVILVWAWAVVHLGQLGNASDAILRENYRSILAAENMIGALERQDSAVLLLLLGYEEQGLQQFRLNESEFLQWLARAKDNVTIEGEVEVLQTIEEEYVAFLAVYSHLRERGIAGEDALSYYEDHVLPRFQVVRDTSIKLRNLNQETMMAASRRAQQIAQRAVWSTHAIGAVVVLLGLALSLRLSHNLVRPLQEMSLAADRIAEGDYEVKLSPGSKDELGHLAERIQTMSYKLRTFHRMNVGRIIAEKKRSDAIIRSITDGIVVVDADLLVVAMNPEAAHILGVKADEVTGEHFYDVVGNQMLYESVREAARHRRSPQLSENEPLFVVNRDDKTEYYRFSITPVKAEKSQMLGVVLLLQDITKLKELDRLKSEFVATVSHELRTPLTSMAMSIGLLLEGAGQWSQRQRDLLQVAQEDVKRLRALVNDLLDLSKIESGRMEMEFATVTVGFLVENALAPFLEQARQKQVDLRSQIPSQAPTVKVDANKIVWVLTNLISNALRYTDPGGNISVSAREAGSFVEIAVADDGAGIPLEYQSKIFDKFVQVKNDRTVGGSGLGLAISKEMVKAHGGIIWVDSQPGKGSTFTFTVPVASPHHPQAPIGEQNGNAS